MGKILSMLKKLKDHPQVPKSFRLFCETLIAMFNHGINQQLLAQLLEVGLQSRLGLGCPMECMAFDSVIYDQQKEWIRTAADRICNVLRDKYEKKSALTSWPPARDNNKELLTKPIVVEAIGFAKNEQRDAFKRPAIPNAATIEEKYAFNYTDAEKQEAIGEIKSSLWQAQVEKQLLVLDRCQSTLGGTVQEVLEQDHNLEFIESIFGGEIHVHKYVGNGSGVLTTKPLHIGGDAQTEKTSIETATLRSMSAAVLQTVVSRLAPPSEEQQQQERQDENKTSIHEASFQYHAMRENMHQNGRVAAVAYRQCNTPKSVDALRNSRLQGWDNDQSIATNIRQMYHAKNCKDENSKRPVDRVIVSVKATNLLSWKKGKEDEVSDQDQLDKELSAKISTEVPAAFFSKPLHLMQYVLYGCWL
jgi:hypothetical protein